jgi:hypothetical protein
MRIKTCFVGSLLALAVLLPDRVLQAQADSTQHAIDPAKAEAIRTYLELSRASELFLVGFEQGMAATPEVAEMPEGFLEQFRAKAREKVPEFIDMLVPVYDRHMTLEELNGLIEFVRSPIGQRFVDLQVELAGEMMELGERWAMMVVGEVFTDMSKKPPQ